MRQWLFAGLIALVALPGQAATAPLDLETIMANPDWIGQAVESPYWSVDGRALYYTMKRDGSNVVTSSACASTSGSWYSDYDGVTFTVAGDLDIDHLVPLVSPRPAN